MAGIKATGQLRPPAIVRSYRAVALLADCPDNTIGLYSLTAGEAAITTVMGDSVTLAIAAGGFAPAEVERVHTWSGSGTLYNVIG